MAAGKTKRNLDKIDDIMEMVEVMKALDISSKGLKGLEDMKERVKTIIGKEASKPTSWNAGEAFKILSDIQDKDEGKRRVLWDLYTEAEETIAKLDPAIGDPLEQNVGNIKGKMKNYKTQLERKEYFVLVAGETGSGKSSLINLILGEDLLPFSVLSTTSTICELKYGEEPKIVAHFKNKDPETGHPTKTIPLKNGDSSEQSYLQQIAPYVHVISDREKGSIYKKIELFWPHPLLKKGIVIIDSPGVGESDIMDAIVTQYLPQAFAFLYVINSANAGGVQKDRLEKLLEEVRKETFERQGEQPTKCALFVCNKWDQVPEKEAKAVKNHVITKLKRCWKSVDPESQIIYMSSQKASKAQNIGIITEEFSTLMNGLRLMVLKSIGESLDIQWRWLDHLLSRIVYQAKAFVMNASRDRSKFDQKIRVIVHRLNLIEQQQIGVVAHLHQYLEKQVDGAFRELLKYFSSKEVKARFTSWTLDEVPRSEDTWEVTRNQITKLLLRRFREFTEQWEEDNKVFANARGSLLQHFQSRYHFVEGQLRSLQSAITAGKKDVPENLTEIDDLDLSLSGKVIIGVTSPIWVPLGLVAFVIGAPVYGMFAFKSKLQDIKKLKTYKKDQCAFMREMSADYLEEVIEEKSLKPFVKEQMKEAQVCLQQIEARLPELIQADKMLYNKLRAETRSQEEITKRYQPIVDEASLVRGRLAVFGFEEVQATHIEADDLKWSEDTSSHLGRGAFANVYIGKMERNENSNLTVALKVYNEVLDAKNASLFMAEVQILRKLSHPHIVKFYGSSLLRKEKEDPVRIILVFEWCKGNLKNHILNNQELIPGKSRRRESIEKVCQWIKEITDALAYIHEQGIVHRDLKLENVLLSEENSVRVSDVGISKEASEITGTIAGSPVYIAPEVFQSELYDSKADIYSLGIILWEVWYGEQAFSKILNLQQQQFFGCVARGERPKPLEGYSKPLWKELMEECWAANPQERPTAEQCLERISRLGG